MTGPKQPAWASVDDESLKIILSALRDDVREVRSTSKGKEVEGTLSDAELALQLYTAELDRATTYVSDRIMTKSVQSAVQTDTNAIVQSEYQESIARRDRAIAESQSAGRPRGQVRMLINTGPSPAELEAWEKLASIHITRSDDVGGEEVSDNITEKTPTEIDWQPESSSWAASRSADVSHQRLCMACCNMHNVMDLTQAPCKHEYCRECLEQLFRNSMSDESLFPPRCCRIEISVEANRLLLGDELVHEFMEKSIEFATTNRIYCHQPTCSAFIPPSAIKDGVAPCPKCKTLTCVTCKGGTHKGDCPSDTALQQVLEVARQNGWQRCPKCSAMIELNYGCFHMTCKCKAQFCYLCAEKWKTCECDQWDMARLLDRARQVYDRNRNPENADGRGRVPNVENPVNPQPAVTDNRTAGIERIAQHLQRDHACDHLFWASRTGRERCEECGDEMSIYIYQCHTCSLRACRRCRFNRL
ncbi:hypothetical protein ANO14919_132210 [Xylariales sp. No.14919]|nr:hypothetical protein ANO14919_132210 [Xylariales sp. No.14919]